MRKKICLLFTLSITCALCLLGCGYTDNTPYTRTGFYFDTVISITLYGEDNIPHIDECFELAALYESYFSTEIPDSDIANINSHAGEAVSVHPETAELIQKGIDYYNSSNGKFDITIGALSSLWHFPGTGGISSADVSEHALSEHISATDERDFIPEIPSPEAIAQALPTIDASKIVIQDNTVMLTVPGSSIDLGGIAKGYIADKMKEYLNSQGITSGTINLGGNLLALGPKKNQDSQSYTIGIQNPFAEDGSAIASIKITDESVVTSGTYQRCFEKDGVLYHHILDTDTGYPYDNGLSSVTVISGNSSADADALSTICFMMGLTDGLSYAESLEDTEAVFITTDEQIYHTSGLGTDIPFKIL